MEKRIANNEIEVRCIVSELRIKQRDETAACRTIVGYAAKFECWSDPIMGWFREKIARGAFEECDLQDVIMCFNHCDDAILARTTSGTLQLEVDDVGLRFSFETPNTSLATTCLSWCGGVMSRNARSTSALRKTSGDIPTSRTAL